MKKILIGSLRAAEFRSYAFETSEGKVNLPKKVFADGIPETIKITIEDERAEFEEKLAKVQEGVKG